MIHQLRVIFSNQDRESASRTDTGYALHPKKPAISFRSGEVQNGLDWPRKSQDDLIKVAACAMNHSPGKRAHELESAFWLIAYCLAQLAAIILT